MDRKELLKTLFFFFSVVLACGTFSFTLAINNFPDFNQNTLQVLYEYWEDVPLRPFIGISMFFIFIGLGGMSIAYHKWRLIEEFEDGLEKGKKIGGN